MDKLKEVIERLKIRSDINPKDKDVALLINLAERYLELDSEFGKLIPEMVINNKENYARALGYNDGIDAGKLIHLKIIDERCKQIYETLQNVHPHIINKQLSEEIIKLMKGSL